MNEIEQALMAVREVYINFPKRITLLEEQLKDLDKEIQDLLHVQELADLNASEGFKQYKEMQKARRERRKVKNELELLEFVKQLQAMGKPSEKVLNKAIGDVRGLSKTQNVRFYKMKIRDDLQELIK